MFVDAFLLAAQLAAAPAAYDVQIPRIEDAVVTIDGRLDEPVWNQAAVLTDFSQYEPVDGRPAAERTEVLVWYAPDAIHFGIRAYDSRPDAIRATVADRDNIDGDDHVILYLDTFNDRRRAFFFAVNPLGIQQDGVRTEGAGSSGSMYGGSTDKSPDYWYESSGRITEDGYVVEVRIPFKSLRYPGNGPQEWGFQVERRIQRTGYTDTWTATRRASASFLAQSGTLHGLHDLERGVVFEAQPFVTGVANGAVNEATGAFERERLDPEAGVNLHVGFTNLSLDATINPDFSQVEADAGQVTINERFALFFAEKRPFFLEGIELFAAPSRLVYTRQIANPIAGGKITGKMGGIGVAHLTALDQAGGEDALFNVTRLRRDFAENSLAGVLYTDRTSLDGDDFNRVVAADVRHVFGGMYFAEAQLGGSWTREAGVERSGPLWKVEIDRTGRHWGFNYRLNRVDADFVTRSGFVNRTGIFEASAHNRLSFYGAPGALAESLNLTFRPSRLWADDARAWSDAIEGEENLSASLRLRGGWRVEATARREFWVLDPDDYARYELVTDDALTPYAPLADVSGPGFSLSASTPTFRTFDASVSMRSGRIAIFDEGSEGSSTSVSADLSLRPNESVRLTFSNTYQHIDRERDGSRFARAIIPRLQAEFQPTRAFFLRAIGEWSSERRDALLDARTGAPLRVDGNLADEAQADALRIDLLASYTPTPGTVAYLGYGSTLGSDDAFAFDRLERASDGFFIKLAYRFRR